MAQALYRKWRSQTFEEVIGQNHVTQTLRNALLDGRVAHAYLFSGPRGTGKTSTARILAKALNCVALEPPKPCNHCSVCIAITEGRMLDLIEIDAASNNSVDDIRELRDKVGFRPSEGQYKIYIIDEVHMLSTAAFNALLKTLEEPPPHARFILATTEPHRIPATVISRCQRFDFRRIPVPEIAGHLQTIIDAENFAAEPEALAAIARSAQGCMRDAVSLLDQMFSYGSSSISLAQVQQVLGTVDSESVANLVTAIAHKDVKAGLYQIHQLLTEGVSLVEFCHQVIEYLRGVLVLQMTRDRELLSDLSPHDVERMAEQAQQMDRSSTLFAIKRFSEAIPDLKGGYQPQLPMELALIEAIQTLPQSDSVPQATLNAGMETDIQSTVSPGNKTKDVQPISTVPDADASPSSSTTTSDSDGAGKVENAQIDVQAVERFRARLSDFKARVRTECGIQTQAALNSVRDIAIVNGTVVFAFGNNSFARDMIMQGETRSAVTRVLSSFLGQTVVLECQTGDKAHVSGLQRQQIDGHSNQGPDPLVEYAVNELGARIKDEKRNS